MTLAPPPVSTPLPAIGLPPRLYIPLPPNAEPKSLNTRITRGENILTDSSRVVLAPSNGEITAITTAKLTNGKDCPLVELTTTETPPAPPAELAPPADLDAFIEALQQAGITIDRRTSPDLLAQLRLAAEKNPIDTILCNFLGEAPSRLNAALGAGLSTEIIAALQRLRELTGAQRCWIAADAAFAATVRPLRRAARRANIRYVPMLNSYPLSDPTMLLYTLLGRRMNPAQLPPQRRVLLLDAAAALAIGRLILHSQPMLDVPIVMRNGFTSQWHVVQVPVGTRVRDVCEQLSIPSDNVTIRAGDVLRDVQISPDAIIASAEISLDISAVTQAVNPSPCIRCGWCVQACPARIHPAGLLEAAQLHDSQLAHRYGVDSCIECGICSYVCPSHLPLLPSIRQLRATISTSS